MPPNAVAAHALLRPRHTQPHQLRRPRHQLRQLSGNKPAAATDTGTSNEPAAAAAAAMDSASGTGTGAGAGGHTYAHTQQRNVRYNPEVVAAAKAAAQDYLTGPKVGLDAADALALAKTAVSTSDMAAADEALLTPRQVFELAITILQVRDTGPASHEPNDDTAVTLAVPLLVLAAERGSDDATYTYASLRLLGKGCEKDPVDAAEIFKNLARDGHTQATYNLAGMYLQGTGVEISVSKAIGLYDLCGKMGNMRGYHAIGDIYLKGKDRPADYPEALKWFELGAESGAESCPYCTFKLARMYVHVPCKGRSIKGWWRSSRLISFAGRAPHVQCTPHVIVGPQHVW